MLNQSQELVLRFCYTNNLVASGLCNPHAIHKLSLLVEVEVEIIGEDDEVQSLLVAVELLLVTILIASVKVVVIHVLCFHEENGQMILFAGDNIVWRTTLKMCRLVCHDHLRQQTLQKVLQCRTIRMLSGNTCPILLIEIIDILF